MKKLFEAFLILMIVVAFIFVSVPAFAAVDIQVKGTSTCTAEHLNYKGESPNCSGNTLNVGGLVTYTYATRPASGAPAGSLIAISDAANAGSCGTASGGSSFNVCVSDGTNWKVV